MKKTAVAAHNVGPFTAAGNFENGHKNLAVEQSLGSEYADFLCVTNPRAALQGEQLPPQEEPRIEDERAEKSFFRRLFNR